MDPRARGGGKLLMWLTVLAWSCSGVLATRGASAQEWNSSQKEPKPKTGKNRETSFWGDGLLLSSSSAAAAVRRDKKGEVRESSVGSNSSGGGGADDDDDKKSLSQQVKEGKYGLIQDELYSGGSAVKRPGIISYMANPDVPKDNAKSLGGLDEDEIWLAENHVLVLRGGKLPDNGDDDDDDLQQQQQQQQQWPPIDDYQAPRRQVKIPAKPKVPPPFPVQLVDGGPLEFLTPPEGAVVADEANVTGATKFKPIVVPEKLVLPLIFPGLPPGAVIVPPPPSAFGPNRTDYSEKNRGYRN